MRSCHNYSARFDREKSTVNIVVWLSLCGLASTLIGGIHSKRAGLYLLLGLFLGPVGVAITAYLSADQGKN